MYWFAVAQYQQNDNTVPLPVFIDHCSLYLQVFIGHAESISQVYFAPDEETFISTGEAIFVWDFLAYHMERPILE